MTAPTCQCGAAAVSRRTYGNVPEHVCEACKIKVQRETQAKGTWYGAWEPIVSILAGAESRSDP